MLGSERMVGTEEALILGLFNQKSTTGPVRQRELDAQLVAKKLLLSSRFLDLEVIGAVAFNDA